MGKLVEENALWKHCMVEHRSTRANFSMKVLGVLQSYLTRQVNEAVRIELSTADCIMNSKAEWRQAPWWGWCLSQGSRKSMVVTPGRRREEGAGEGVQEGGEEAELEGGPEDNRRISLAGTRWTATTLYFYLFIFVVLTFNWSLKTDRDCPKLVAENHLI